MNVDSSTAQILVFGTLMLAFGGFASFMADRQKQREKLESPEVQARCAKQRESQPLTLL